MRRAAMSMSPTRRPAAVTSVSCSFLGSPHTSSFSGRSPIRRDFFVVSVRSAASSASTSGGRVSRTASLSMPTLEERMDDIRAVLDAVGVERAALLGLSEGGPLSVLFAATYPERTVALVLWNTFARLTQAPGYPFGFVPEVFDQVLETYDQLWGTGAFLSAFVPSGAEDESFQAWWARFEREAMSPGAAVQSMRMNRDIDVRDVLPLVHTPTLVVSSIGDVLAKASPSSPNTSRVPCFVSVRDRTTSRGSTWTLQTSSRSSSPAHRVFPISTERWRPSSSPTSWDRPLEPPRSGIDGGASCWTPTMTSSQGISSGSGVGWSRTPATGVSPPSMVLGGRCGARSPCATVFETSASRPAAASTPERWSCGGRISAESECTLLHACPPLPAPATSWCRERSSTSSSARASPSTTAANSFSRVSPEAGDCSPWRADDESLADSPFA